MKRERQREWMESQKEWREIGCERHCVEGAAEWSRKEEIKRCNVKQGNLWVCDLIKQETGSWIWGGRSFDNMWREGMRDGCSFVFLCQVCSVVRYRLSGETEGILIVHTKTQQRLQNWGEFRVSLGYLVFTSIMHMECDDGVCCDWDVVNLLLQPFSMVPTPSQDLVSWEGHQPIRHHNRFPPNNDHLEVRLSLSPTLTVWRQNQCIFTDRNVFFYIPANTIAIAKVLAVFSTYYLVMSIYKHKLI